MHVNVRIVAVDDPAPWPLNPGQESIDIELEKVAILEKGCQSGKVSLCMLLDLPLGAKPGTVACVQMTPGILDMIFHAAKGASMRFGSEFP